MAGLSSMEKILKIGRLTVLSHIKVQNVARSICTRTLYHHRNTLSSVEIVTNTQRLFATTTDNSNSPENLEAFRNREEQREEEFNKTQPNDADKKVDKIRTDILNAALPFVDSLGWTRDTLAKGAESIGYPGIVHGIFPNGAIELIHHFYKECNDRLMIVLGEENNCAKENPVDLVKKAIKIRLQMNEAYLKNWPQALAMMALPPNVPKSLALQLTLVDDICFMAGDRSVDFGWYTRRIGVATIYKLTELYMLRDQSTNFVETWKFLERRIDEGQKIQATLVLGETTSKHMTQVLSSAFQTARNILGLHFSRR